MVNLEIMIQSVTFFCILGLLAATVPYKIKIPERKRILYQAKRPKKFF
jgi:hypothetical protein